MIEEVRYYQGYKMMLLSFDDASIDEIETYLKDKNLPFDANSITHRAIVLFTKRWEKKYGHKPRHIFITELGPNNTERVHIHGLMILEPSMLRPRHQMKKTIEEVEKIWKYGKVFIGHTTNEKTVNYIAKYILKPDPVHPNFVGDVRASKGIGKTYLNKWDADQNRFRGEETVETYKTPSGRRIALPPYYRNKIYNIDQRETLRLIKEDKETRYMMGHKYEMKTDEQREIFERDREYFRMENIRKGYGTNDEKYKKQSYNARGGKIMNNPRIKGKGINDVDKNNPKIKRNDKRA